MVKSASVSMNVQLFEWMLQLMWDLPKWLLVSCAGSRSEIFHESGANPIVGSIFAEHTTSLLRCLISVFHRNCTPPINRAESTTGRSDVASEIDSL